MASGGAVFMESGKITVHMYSNMSKSETSVQFTLSNRNLTDANNFFDSEACLELPIPIFYKKSIRKRLK